MEAQQAGRHFLPLCPASRHILSDDTHRHHFPLSHRERRIKVSVNYGWLVFYLTLLPRGSRSAYRDIPFYLSALLVL